MQLPQHIPPPLLHVSIFLAVIPFPQKTKKSYLRHIRRPLARGAPTQRPCLRHSLAHAHPWRPPLAVHIAETLFAAYPTHLHTLYPLTSARAVAASA